MKLVLYLIFIVFVCNAQSAIYECTIEGGKVTFSDRPCEGKGVTEIEVTRYSDFGEIDGISEKSDVNISLDMHRILDLKFRGRSSKDICYRRDVFGDYRVHNAVSNWEKRNKVKLDEITEILNNSDSTAYQYKLIDIYRKYIHKLERSSIKNRLKVCGELLIELGT